MTTQYRAEHQGQAAIHDTENEACEWLMQCGCLDTAMGEWHPHVVTITDADGHQRDVLADQMCSYSTAAEARADDWASADGSIVRIRESKG